MFVPDLGYFKAADGGHAELEDIAVIGVAEGVQAAGHPGVGARL